MIIVEKNKSYFRQTSSLYNLPMQAIFYHQLHSISFQKPKKKKKKKKKEKKKKKKRTFVVVKSAAAYSTWVLITLTCRRKAFPY